MAVDAARPTGELFRVHFRRLVDRDLATLHAWLNEPGVVRWWEGDDVSWDAIVRDYGSASTDPAEHWISTVDGRDVGWIQCYATADYANEDEVRHWWRLGVDRSAAGIDYLVGDAADRGRGLGTAIIRAFLNDIVLALHTEWTEVCASPLAANVASWRALEKAGFATMGGFEDKHGPCRLMVARRCTAEGPR